MRALAVAAVLAVAGCGGSSSGCCGGLAKAIENSRLDKIERFERDLQPALAAESASSLSDPDSWTPESLRAVCRRIRPAALPEGGAEIRAAARDFDAPFDPPRAACVIAISADGRGTLTRYDVERDARLYIRRDFRGFTTPPRGVASVGAYALHASQLGIADRDFFGPPTLRGRDASPDSVGWRARGVLGSGAGARFTADEAFTLTNADGAQETLYVVGYTARKLGEPKPFRETESLFLERANAVALFDETPGGRRAFDGPLGLLGVVYDDGSTVLFDEDDLAAFNAWANQPTS